MIFRIDLKIFILGILFYLTKQIEIYGIIMIFAIMHEFGHLLAGILLKMKVNKITLMPIGFSIEFALEPEDYNIKLLKSNKLEAKRLIVAMAGPFINLLIMIIICFINIHTKAYQMIFYTNFLIAIFNLIPIYPLDGGRILKSILSLILNKKNATIYINKISNICLFIITFLFSILIYQIKNISLLIILIYLWYLVLKENKIYKLKIRLYEMIKSL